jgi:hypothetical protein
LNATISYLKRKEDEIKVITDELSYKAEQDDHNQQMIGSLKRIIDKLQV